MNGRGHRRGTRWRRAPLAAALTALLTLASAAAEAQLLKPNSYPLPKDGLLLFDMLRPVETDDLLHSWRANIGYQHGALESKLASQPERRNINSETVGLNARVGQRGFAGLDLTLSDQTLKLRANGITTYADVNEAGVRASGGYMPLPYLAVGGSIARNKLDGTYRFGPSPTDQASGALMSYSLFSTLLIPADAWKFSLTAAYSHDEVVQSFADGAPPEQKAWARNGSLVLAALHPIAGRLDGVASLMWNHTFEQRTFLAGRSFDEDWLRPALGLVYRATDNMSLSLVASRYLLNEVYDYESVAFGLSYRF